MKTRIDQQQDTMQRDWPMPIQRQWIIVPDVRIYLT